MKAKFQIFSCEKHPYIEKGFAIKAVLITDEELGFTGITVNITGRKKLEANKMIELDSDLIKQFESKKNPGRTYYKYCPI